MSVGSCGKCQDYVQYRSGFSVRECERYSQEVSYYSKDCGSECCRMRLDSNTFILLYCAADTHQVSSDIAEGVLLLFPVMLAWSSALRDVDIRLRAGRAIKPWENNMLMIAYCRLVRMLAREEI